MESQERVDVPVGLDDLSPKGELALKEFQANARWLRLVEIALTSIVGGIPRPLGTLARRLLYRFILAKVGHSLKIHGTGVDLIGAKQIEIGNGVQILRDVQLDGYAPNSKIKLDDHAYLHRGVTITTVPHLGNCLIEIGKETMVGAYTCIYGPGSIKIGANCLIAPQVGIFASSYNISDPTRNISKQGFTCKGIVIEEDCWLGTGVKVLDGVTIGKGSVIGAGAVVTKDIPPYSIAVGVPAKVVSSRT